MKTAVILFTNPIYPLDAEYVTAITKPLLFGGYPVTTTEIISIDDDLGFKRSIERYKDTADNLIIVNNQDVTFSIKQIIADQTDTALIENENASKFLDAVKKAHGKEYSDDNAVMPVEATLIPNLNGAFQGFMMDDNDFTLVVLPSDALQFRVACENYLLPYLDKKYSKQTSKLTLKYFGGEEKLKNAIANAKQKVSGRVECNYSHNNGDFTISVLSDKTVARELARLLVGELKDEIYAEIDTSLGERLFDLLRLKKLKLATAESFTGGRVVGSVITNSGASAFVHEGIVCYTNDSKANRLNINLDDILKDGAVSSMTAYRMAAGLLKTGKVDIAISTTGFAGPKTDDSDEPVGLAYVGIGMMDGVHTYRLNLSGSREEITETAKNTALFLAIKKLKSIK